MAEISQVANLSGKWQCRYWYPSNTHEGEDVSEYIVRVHQMGNDLVLESEPNAQGAYMFVRLVLDGDLATGTWHESTSPAGEFEGAIYSGAVQLLVNGLHDTLKGKWVGIGQEKGVRQIYGGNWELNKL